MSTSEPKDRKPEARASAGARLRGSMKAPRRARTRRPNDCQRLLLMLFELQHTPCTSVQTSSHEIGRIPCKIRGLSRLHVVYETRGFLAEPLGIAQDRA